MRLDRWPWCFRFSLQQGVFKVKELNPQTGMRAFFIVWCGQLISVFGTNLTGFALGIYVLKHTGSVTQFGLVILAITLPSVIVSPIAGVLVDRWDRRWAMFMSDSGAALSTLGIALLLIAGRLEVWHIGVAAGIAAIFGTFRAPAYNASVPMLVPKQHLARANGLSQTARGLGKILAPVVAAVLINSIQVQGVILVDFATYLFALLTLILVRIPKPTPTSEDPAAKPSMVREALYGWTYIKTRLSLLQLLYLFAIINFLMATIEILIPPMVLGFASVATLGAMGSVFGAGMLAGSIALGAWGGPKRQMRGVLGFLLLQGVALVFAGLRPSTLLVFAMFFLWSLSSPILNGCNLAIWQRKTAPDVQGRVYALGTMLSQGIAPVAILITGPLADRVFQPLLINGGALAGSLGRVIGTGPGRGIGLMFIILGLLTSAITVSAYLRPSLRLIEDRLPDAIPDVVPAAPVVVEA